jgi:hypothetical protein
VIPIRTQLPALHDSEYLASLLATRNVIVGNVTGCIENSFRGEKLIASVYVPNPKFGYSLSRRT